MLKVLIADDEPRVGQLVKHLIHWDELGLSFVDYCAIIGLNQKDLENQGILA